VALPWLLRQASVFGSLSPSSAGGRILFITEYRELYSVSSETTLEAFLGQGLASLVQSRLEGLWDALLIFVASPMLVLLVPPLLIGIWVSRHSRDFAPWFVYVLALFVFTALVSAVHVPFGTFIHSAVALLPHAYLLVMVGVTTVVGWIAARRSGWDAPRASRNIGFMTVAVVVVVTVFATTGTIDAWKRERGSRTEVLAALEELADPADVIMSPDAGAYQFHGDWAGIVTPDDPLAVVEDALRLYDVRWLVLEGDHPTIGLRPVLKGEVRPRWLSEPLVMVPPVPSEGDDEGTDEPLPRAALYAVCLEADDQRCAS
jgi:hypothetical protein